MRTLKPAFALLLSAACACLVAFAPGSASAQVVLGADANVAVTATPKVVSTGYGGAARLGYRFRIPLVALTPEVGAAYHHFGSSPAGSGIFRGFSGARVALGEVVKPSVYGHAGYASTLGTGSTAAFTYDLGAALDFTALPVLDFGIHAAYASMATAGSSLDWIDLGAQIAIVF